MPNSKIYFPVLKKLAVSGHSMFPGESGDGFEHDFPSGVSIIVGVNGIGKTTLLNMIYRMLVGPVDPSKTEDNEVKITVNKLSKNKKFDYFSRRDNVGRTSSTAVAVFVFGSRSVRVERELKNLSIISLIVDGEEQDIDDDETILWKLSGCGSRYDFHYLMRTVAFFLEDKTPVVWDKAAQSELFRVLFLDTKVAREMSVYSSEIQSADSGRRNLVNQVNRYKDSIKDENPYADESKSVLREHVALLERIDTLKRQLEGVKTNVFELRQERDEVSQKLESNKLNLEESYRDLEFAHHHYFSTLFPELPDVVKNVYTNLVGGTGCMVCGSRSSNLKLKFQGLASKGLCPVCESPQADHENCVSKEVFAASSISEKNEKVDRLKEIVEKLRLSREAVIEELDEAYKAQSNLFQELDQAKRDAERLSLKLPMSHEELNEKELFIQTSNKRIREYDQDISEMMQKHSVHLAQLSSEVDQIKEMLVVNFESYSANFLAEQCSLTFQPSNMNLGQNQKVIYPTFDVLMTSGVSPDAGTPRSQYNDVSESQKEFIDLAFRMAVLRTYSEMVGEDRSSMIVIETPEASLDSVFVYNAGKMLRNWCDTGESVSENSIIASSNLNRENMIPSLLGLGQGEGAYPSESEIQSRILNLLEIAAESASLRTFRAEYEKELSKAVTPPSSIS